MGPIREMHQLGATVRDGWRPHGRANGGRRSRSTSREMHQPDAPLRDDRRRRGHCRWRVTWQGPYQDRHHLAATVRQDRRRRRGAYVSRGKDPSSGVH